MPFPKPLKPTRERRGKVWSGIYSKVMTKKIRAKNFQTSCMMTRIVGVSGTIRLYKGLRMQGKREDKRGKDLLWILVLGHDRKILVTVILTVTRACHCHPDNFGLFQKLPVNHSCLWANQSFPPKVGNDRNITIGGMRSTNIWNISHFPNS